MSDATLVDFHCHLDLHPNMQVAFDRCDRLGCTTFTVTTTPKAYARNEAFAARSRHVRAALGLHPQLVEKRGDEIELFEELAERTRYIGEIGLDASRNHYPSFERQKQVFDCALAICASQGDKIISVHSARCTRLVLDSLERASVTRSCKVVLHWFSASKADIQRAIDIGCWFSVNEKMLSTSSGRALIEMAPKGCILTETDAPFIETFGRQIKAGDVTPALEAISAQWDLTVDDTRGRVLANAQRVLA